MRRRSAAPSRWVDRRQHGRRRGDHRLVQRSTPACHASGSARGPALSPPAARLSTSWRRRHAEVRRSPLRRRSARPARPRLLPGPLRPARPDSWLSPSLGPRRGGRGPPGPPVEGRRRAGWTVGKSAQRPESAGASRLPGADAELSTRQVRTNLSETARRIGPVQVRRGPGRLRQDSSMRVIVERRKMSVVGLLG